MNLKWSYVNYKKQCYNMVKFSQNKYSINVKYRPFICGSRPRNKILL